MKAYYIHLNMQVYYVDHVNMQVHYVDCISMQAYYVHQTCKCIMLTV